MWFICHMKPFWQSKKRVKRDDVEGVGVSTDVTHVSQSDTFSDNVISSSQYIAYAICLLLTFIALYFTVSGGDIIGPASVWIYGILALNFALITYFVIGVWRRFSHILRIGRTSQIGAKLYVRYVRLFVSAAAIPSIIIALFSGLTIGRGVQAWLSGQVGAAIESTAGFGKETIKQATDAVQADIVAMALDLNAAAGQFEVSPEAYQTYLTTQTNRRGFVAAYLYTSDGKMVMAAARPQGAPRRMSPDSEDLATARAGAVDMNIDDTLTIRALFRLSGYESMYLQVVRIARPEQVRLLTQAQEVVSAYRVLEDRQSQIQIIFALAYLETVLLVGVGAALLGMSYASRISVPITNLAQAAEKVRAGDLSVRVTPDRSVEELYALTNTFNRMTNDLGQQQDALLSARLQAERRTEFIQTLFDGVSAGIVSMNANRQILAANDSAARLLGITHEDLLDLGLLAVAPEFADVINNSKIGLVSQAHIERNDNESQMVFDVKASYVGTDIVITFDEVSSMLAAQRQAAWKDVARRIAHEIKNPLTPIQLSAERLARKFGKDIQTDRDIFLKMTDTIIRQVADIGRMVDEFSDFARMPAPKFAIDDLAEIVRQAVFAQKIANSGIEYSIECPPEPVLVSMDSRLIGQALTNLLKNAAEAIGQVEAKANSEKAKAQSPQISISIDYRGENIGLDICDTGIGFPKQGRQRLLEPYMTTRAKGTGLGLAIVARVLEEHGGSLNLGDRPDNKDGACVTIILPSAAGTAKEIKA